MVLPTGEYAPVPKQLVIRNTTRQDIVLKIKSDAPRALQFEAEKIVVDSRKYVIVNMVFNEKELASSPQIVNAAVCLPGKQLKDYDRDGFVKAGAPSVQR
ncbi:hypothetical protein OESDEN_04060 [Oesophagostomum dentatum]|uniref:Major sperm protein n=1 Tax=Oesophagostomum dentatum TaxID=61180 RepID=A0A0B1TEJ3_OESDE|nr:hypothetical protein OESDEN_04060 [Oesophagostomum dentatum]